MLRKLLIIFFISIPLLSSADDLSLQQIKQQQSQLVGKIRFTKWFFNIYDAELYTTNGSFNWHKPFLLKVYYLRNFSGKSIAKHTIKEIYRQHPKEVASKYNQYENIFECLFPDIKKHSSLYGYMDKNGNGFIYSDSGLIGEIPTKQLSKYFFEIWLGNNSSNVKLSQQLRGL